VQIQDWLIAAIQNIKILLRAMQRCAAAAQAVALRDWRAVVSLLRNANIRVWHHPRASRWSFGIRTDETAFAT